MDAGFRTLMLQPNKGDGMRKTCSGLMLLIASGAAFATEFEFAPYLTYHPGSRPDAVAAGDLNGDGRNDVVVTTTAMYADEHDNSVFIYLQQNDGRLAAPRKFRHGGGNRTDISLFDANEDGMIDIVVGHGGGLTLLLSDGAGGFTSEEEYIARETSYLATLDVNLDGHVDVIGQSWGDDAIIFFGDGRGNFPRTSVLPTSARGYNDVAVGDVTGDGFSDVVIVSTQSIDAFFLIEHDGVGGFLPERSFPVPSGVDYWGSDAVTVADINRDGYEDVVVASGGNRPNSSLWVYRQDPAGVLQGPTRMASHDIPRALETADLDGDGRDDVLVKHDGWGVVGRYMQKSYGGLDLEILTSAPTNGHSNSLAVADVTGDGCPDAMSVDYNNGLVVLPGTFCRSRRVRSDMDGDGKSDLLWRNYSTGVNAIWSSGNYRRQKRVAQVESAHWQMLGTGDFDGDGSADILWRHSNGSGVIWPEGDHQESRWLTHITNPDWRIVGIGDFNGDSQDDLLWRNMSTGANAIWQSADYGKQQKVTGVRSLQWHVAGVDDFNGDGVDDVVWRHSVTGVNTIWRSASYASQLEVRAVSSTAWEIAGTGDFDADGRADLFWRNRATGANAIWRAARFGSQIEVTPLADGNWQLVSAADFNGDGHADVAWRNIASGENMVWSSGASSSPQTAIDVTNTAWRVVP